MAGWWSGALALALAGLGCGDPGAGDDAPAADGGAGDAGDHDDGGAGDDAAWIFDEGVIRTYELDVAPADWAWLNEHALEETYVPATLRQGEEEVAAAVRYKGSVGSLAICFDGEGNRTCDKLSIKVSFDEVDPDGRFHGVRKLNFHGMESDPTQMHDAIGYRIFREAGVPASRTAYARLVVNGDPLGLFVLVEQVDGRFTRARFPDGGEGNLYKEVWPVHATAQPYLDALETNRDEDPSADKMVRFAAAIAAAGDDGLAATIDAWTDADAFVGYHAVARLLDSWDDVVGWYCVGEGACFNHNFYWYESTADDRVWLIPWDLDHSLEEPSPIRAHFGMPDWDDVDASCEPIPIFLGIEGRAPACDPFLRAIVTQLWDRYAARSQALLDGAFAEAALDARIDELAARIGAAVAEDPHGPGTAAWEAAVADLRDDVRAKRAHIEGKL
jgi:hypothetical protein